MTKDLALAIYGKNMKREHWVVTNVYMDAVNVRDCKYALFLLVYFKTLMGLSLLGNRINFGQSSQPGRRLSCDSEEEG